MIMPKERKYVECFKSKMDGSCNWCTRTWRKDNKIYAMKKDDGKWIACTDRQCYLDQGGKITVFQAEPQTPSWELSSDEIFDLRVKMEEMYGIDKAEKLWRNKILPAINLYSYIKRKKYETLSN